MWNRYVENFIKKKRKEKKNRSSAVNSPGRAICPWPLCWSSFFQEQFRFAEIALTFRPRKKKKKEPRSYARWIAITETSHCWSQRPMTNDLFTTPRPFFFLSLSLLLLPPPCRWTKSINGGFDTNLMDLLLLRRVLNAHVCKQCAQ